MSKQRSKSNLKSCIAFIAMGYFFQLLDVVELTDSAYNLQGPYNDDGLEYGGYYPGITQEGYPINNVPVSQTPIFQSSYGTKGGSKARQDYGGGNNHWWNWKNVVHPRPAHIPGIMLHNHNNGLLPPTDTSGTSLFSKSNPSTASGKIGTNGLGFGRSDSWTLTLKK